MSRNVINAAATARLSAGPASGFPDARFTLSSATSNWIALRRNTPADHPLDQYSVSTSHRVVMLDVARCCWQTGFSRCPRIRAFPVDRIVGYFVAPWFYRTDDGSIRNELARSRRDLTLF
jgi:hypothetical protein